MCSGRAAQQLQDELEKRYPEIMSPRLAGQYLGVHFTTIYRYMRAGVLKAAQLPGKTLVRKSDLDSLFVSSDGYKVHQKPGSASPKEYTTVKETAERYSLSTAGAYKILKENKVPAYTIKGKAYYSLSTVTSLFRQREANSFPEITEWYTTREIQEKYGMTELAVYSFASEHGIPRKRVKRSALYSKIHIDRLKRQDDITSSDFYTVMECMEQYGMTRDQVYYYLKTYGIERIYRGKYCLFRKKDFDKIFQDD